MLLPRPLMSTVSAILAVLVVSTLSVLADTEIRNFHLPLPPSTRSVHPNTHILDIPLPISPLLLNISTERPELWIRTPLKGYTSWTARISWPASTPTKFEMEVLQDSEFSNEVIIHLSASLLSPRFPRQPFASNIEPSTTPGDDFSTTFALVVEPLILGVLPKTAIPALGWILIFGLGAAGVVPSIIRYFDAISRDGKEIEEERKSI